MPSFIDLPASALDVFNVEDVNKYAKLPYYYAPLEVQIFAYQQTFNQLFGKTPWKANMGPIMRGVRAEPTPKARQSIYPNPIQQAPLRDVFETKEFSEDCVVKRHYFDSHQFNFLPSFQDFRTNQLDFNHKDITQQIAYAADIYTRAVLLQKCRYMYICGNKQGGPLQTVPFIPPQTDITLATVGAMGKGQNFFADLAQNKIGHNLKLRDLSAIGMEMRDTLGLNFFDGSLNTPKDNQLLKGRYAYIGGNEAYQMLPWDDDFSRFRNVNFDIVANGWSGSIFNILTWKSQKYPLRFLADGSFPEPEVVNDDGLTIINPNYAGAPFQVDLCLAADAAKTVTVGPPPSEFADQQISKEKFFSMKWNGEVQLIDNFLTKDGAGNVDINNRGEFLKLISTLTFATTMLNPRAVIAVAFARQKLT